MTINEAIKHCEEVAQDYRHQRDDAANINDFGTELNCQQCASDHEQLAGWLKELIEARHYLVEAVYGFRALGKYLDEHCKIDLDCDKCPLNNGGNCKAWKHTKAVMKLIGGK